MILKDKVFCNENFSVIAGGEVCKDVVKLCVGIKNNEDPIKVQVVCGRLTMNEMKELRDYIDGILKTYENDSNKEGDQQGPKPKKGEWLRMSYLTEEDDDRYKCSRCGNVIHYKNKMDLYTFNSWCGRCGSDNGRHVTEDLIKRFEMASKECETKAESEKRNE